MRAFTMEHLPSIHEGRTTVAPLVAYIVAIDVAQIRFPAAALSRMLTHYQALHV